LSPGSGLEKAENPREKAKIALDLIPPALIANEKRTTVAQVSH
jgi:hypothetical protein